MVLRYEGTVLFVYVYTKLHYMEMCDSAEIIRAQGKY